MQTTPTPVTPPWAPLTEKDCTPLVCPSCGGRELHILPKPLWYTDNPKLGCERCRRAFEMPEPLTEINLAD